MCVGSGWGWCQSVRQTPAYVASGIKFHCDVAMANTVYTSLQRGGQHGLGEVILIQRGGNMSERDMEDTGQMEISGGGRLGFRGQQGVRACVFSLRGTVVNGSVWVHYEFSFS